MRKRKTLVWLLAALLLAGLAAVLWGLLPGDSVGWQEKNGRSFYINEQGDPLTGLRKLGEDTYYFAPDGSVTSGWAGLRGKRYYFDAHGKMVTGWQELEGERYYFAPDGTMTTGWQQLPEGRYYFDAQGKCQTGWLELAGQRYLLGPDGKCQSGWLEDARGRRCFNEEGRLLLGWQELDGQRYFFDEEGYAQTGFLDWQGHTYYLDETGAMVTGFADTDRGRILLGEDGMLDTGWQQWQGNSYYLDEQGIPLTGWHTIDEVPCLFGEDGARYLGFLEEDGVHRYLTETGYARGILETAEGTFYFDQWGKQILLVNPWNPLPEGYQADLVYSAEFDGYLDKSCRRALELMLSDARKEGYDPVVISGWRSWEVQSIAHEGTVQRLIKAGYSPEDAYRLASREVAVPGTSEHQLGLAFDIVDRQKQDLTEEQEKTDTQMWLIENCWEYGFILRYPEGTSELTGIIYEPWHYRYVGQELSMELCRRGLICLEQYLLDITEEAK